MLRGERRRTGRFFSCVRGYHAYQDICETEIKEELECRREPSNLKDYYAIAVIGEEVIVGHLPRKISVACSLFVL